MSKTFIVYTDADGFICIETNFAWDLSANAFLCAALFMKEFGHLIERKLVGLCYKGNAICVNKLMK